MTPEQLIPELAQLLELPKDLNLQLVSLSVTTPDNVTITLA